MASMDDHSMTNASSRMIESLCTKWTKAFGFNRDDQDEWRESGAQNADDTVGVV